MLEFLFGKSMALLMRDIEEQAGKPVAIPLPKPETSSATLWSFKLPGLKATLDENDNLVIGKDTLAGWQSLTLGPNEVQHLTQWLGSLIEPPAAPQKQAKDGADATSQPAKTPDQFDLFT
jgi:hypothetical protein